MSEMVERVVFHLETERVELWQNLIEAGFDVEGVISAVIAAMREPTEAMWKAGQASIDKDEAAANAHFVWRAMNDAALAD